ncbi:MAG TPA: ThuA domain-containing protein [Verrucomicrobiota bacterium]|nr:ThuA domain-containing protein [Verrucomicrobiota bacterium]HNU52852.1 ThuA domain-containing protein [Verrucomicrobiota bacterium]
MNRIWPWQESRERWRSVARRGCAAAWLILAGLTLPGWGASPAEDALALENARIQEALPRAARAQPVKPRRLLIYDGNVGYGGHPSAAVANRAFTRMGGLTGAFSTVVSRDPDMFLPERLRSFDAVFFNNTVGNLFTNVALRQSLIEFVYSGGGLMGVHGTSVAFTVWPGATEDWPEFGLMLGARGANHRESTEHVVIKLDDPTHPVNAVFGGRGFEYRDEFFRVHDPYSRHRVRVLFSIDTERSSPDAGAARGNCHREDGDYALAWIRNYGRGRVFYCTIAHNPYVFWDPRMLAFYLDAVQFVLGDLPAPTTPSARLTPAVLAQERLRWRSGLVERPGSAHTVLETAAAAARAGRLHIGLAAGQVVSADIPRPLGPDLGEADMAAIRVALDAKGVRLLTFDAGRLPSAADAWHRLFSFARRIGVDALEGEPDVSALALGAELAAAHDIRLALRAPEADRSGNLWRPERMARLLEGQPRQVGASVDLDTWMRRGVSPIRGLRLLKERAAIVHLYDADRRGPRGREVALGTGAARVEDVLAEVHRLGLHPVLFAIRTGPASRGHAGGEAADAAFFDRCSVTLESQSRTLHDGTSGQ